MVIFVKLLTLADMNTVLLIILGILILSLLVFAHRILLICKTIKYEIIHHAWEYSMNQEALKKQSQNRSNGSSGSKKKGKNVIG